MFPETISNEQINELPLFKYEGKVIVVLDPSKVKDCFKQIMNEPFVGFDTETRPNFVKGVVHPMALMQIAMKDKVFIFRILSTGITEDMLKFFSTPIIKVGIALHDDIKALRREKEFEPQGFLNLGDVTGELGIHNKGLRKLAGILLEERISKSQQLSNWENERLTPAQIQYAATDAWACWKMYAKLNEKGYI